MRTSCRTTRPGLGPAADLPLLLRQKTEARKGDPGDGGPLRGLPTPLAPKSGSVRNSLRSDSGRFFIRFRHQRRGAINGDFTATATATVAARVRARATATATATATFAAQRGPMP